MLGGSNGLGFLGWPGVGGFGRGIGAGNESSPLPPPSHGLIDDELPEERLDALRIILYELNAAIAPRKARLRAIRAALAEFDHDEAVLHDEELDVQADRILFQKLAFAYAVSRNNTIINNRGMRARQSYPGADEELELIATALEMVYRASRRMVALSFTEVGRSMLPLCVDMIGNPNPAPPPEPEPPSTVKNNNKEADKDGENGVNGNASQGENVAADSQEITKDNADDSVPQEVSTLSSPDSAEEEKKDDTGAAITHEGTPVKIGGSKDQNASSSGYDTLQTETSTDIDSSPGESENALEGDENYSASAEGRIDGNFGNDQAADLDRADQGLTHNDRTIPPLTEDEPDTSSSPSIASSDDSSLDPLSLKLSATSLAPKKSKPETVISNDDDETNVSEISDNVGTGLPHSGSANIGVQIAGGNATMQTGRADNNAAKGATAIKRNEPLGFKRDASKYADDVDEDEDLYVAWAHSEESANEKDDGKEKTVKFAEDNTKQLTIRFWDDPSIGDTSTHSGRSEGKPSSAEVLQKEWIEDDEGRISNVATSKIVKIFRYYSRVLSAMSPMAHQAGLLDALIYQMSRRLGAYQRQSASQLQDENQHSRHKEEYGQESWLERQKRRLDAEVSPIRVDAAATLVNLACAEENKRFMLSHHGLLEAVLEVANHDPSEEAREHGAIILMNLSYADENKIVLGSHEEVLSTLGELAGDRSPFTRRYATAAIFTLACIPSNTRNIAFHRNGFILSALSRVLLEDPVEEARINAAEACFNLAKNASKCSDENDETILGLGNHVGLMPSLAHAVMADSNADVRTFAARSLEWMASDIDESMPCHDNLLRCLTKATLWSKTTCIVEALAAQAMVTENRAAMIEHDGLLDSLASLALLDGIDDEDIRSCAVSTLVELSKEESLRCVMARNEGVITALTHSSFHEEGVNDAPKTKLSTKVALKNLAKALED